MKRILFNPKFDFVFKFNQYVEGFLQTNQLNGLIRNIDDFNFPLKKTFLEKSFPKINRLGKRVEFIFEEIIKQDDSFVLLHSNVQLFQDKKTIGEIDYIFERKNILFHLEISYKFYLYDESHSNSLINCWIGPNRKDSLKLKLSKLQLNQFPIIQCEEFRRTRKKLNLNRPLRQMLLLKAQLFIPFEKSVELPENYNNCVEGSWLSMQNIHLLSKEDDYFIPEKKDWIINPKENQYWYSKEILSTKVIEYHKRDFSPLVWLKTKENKFSKLFLVWW